MRIVRRDTLPSREVAEILSAKTGRSFEVRPEGVDPDPITTEPTSNTSLMQSLGGVFAGAGAQLGALAGRAKMLGGAAALALVLSGCATSLPRFDAATTTHAIEGRPAAVQVVGAPTAEQLAERPSLEEAKGVAQAFDDLKTIGGGEAVARLLEDNLEAWNARWEAMAGAQSSIHTAYFSLEKDVFGFAYLGHLYKKQRAGVPVRLMVDAMADAVGSNGFKMPFLGRDYLQELVGAGAEVNIYHPVHHRPFKLDGYAFMASNHDKILTVDEMISFTGGRNVAIDYYAHPIDMPHAWRDTDVMLTGRGPAIAMNKAIDAELQHESIISKVNPDRLGNWYARDVELLGAYLIMDLWLKDPAFTEAQKAALRSNPNAKKAVAAELVERAALRLPSEGVTRAPAEPELEFLRGLAEQLVDQLEVRGSQKAYLERKDANYDTVVKILDQTSVAGVRVNDFDVGLLQLVQAAKKSIIIQNPYVVLTEDMINALTAASRRGVEIIIGTNSPLSTDSAVTQAFFLEDWAHVLARVPTARIFVATGQRKLHAKVATIDDDISIVSTYNLDLLSGYVNSEVGAVLKSRAFNARMKEVFLADHADPKNGVLEYTIEKDESGRAVLVGGKPKVVFGPDDHLPKKVLEDYAKRRKNWMRARDNLPYFRPLRRPMLEYAVTVPR